MSQQPTPLTDAPLGRPAAAPDRHAGRKRLSRHMGRITRWPQRALVSTALLLVGAGLTSTAHALDGCQVLLCLAAPNWRAIPQCVPTIRELLRDLVRGHAFPSCATAGTGNNAGHQWTQAPTLCPPQYTLTINGPNGLTYQCLYSGVVTLNLRGAFWSRTWWDLDGASVTEFGSAAKHQLGIWNTQFDDDHARWLATQPTSCQDC